MKSEISKYKVILWNEETLNFHIDTLDLYSKSSIENYLNKDPDGYSFVTIVENLEEADKFIKALEEKRKNIS
jgi:hypothetical protein